MTEFKVRCRAVGRSENLSGQVIIQGLLKKRLCVYSNKNLTPKSLRPLWFKLPKPFNFTSVTVRYADWSWSCDWLKDVKFSGAGIWALDLVPKDNK